MSRKQYISPEAEIVLFHTEETLFDSLGDNFVDFGETDNFYPYE